jgi:hypothetical protein
MQRSDRFFRTAKALIDDTVFKVDRSQLTVPATGEKHLSRLVVESTVDGVFKLIYKVANALGGIPLSDSAIVRA